MQHAIGAILILAVFGTILWMTVDSLGWKGAAVVWGGTIAMCVVLVTGMALLSS